MYDSTGLIHALSVPAGSTTSQNYWSLFTLNGTTITDQNTFSATAPLGCGTSSGGTPSITGLVYDGTSFLPLSGVSVSAPGLTTTTTSITGAFTLTGAAVGSYTLTFTRTGYTTTTTTVSVFTTGGSAGLVYMSPSSASGTATISGTVVNASTGVGISGVTVSGTGLTTATSSSTGAWSITSVAVGTYTLNFSASGYTSTTASATVVTAGSTVTVGVVSMSTAITGSGFRVVLSWALTPSDLDLHVLTPSGQHIYYGNPIGISPDVGTTLDHEVTTGYGPETISVTAQQAGVYKFFVRNFSITPALTASSAVANVYNSSGLLHTLSVPAGATSTTIYWNMFTVNGNTITDVNTLVAVLPLDVLPPFLRDNEFRVLPDKPKQAPE